jgi:hypothetical protein
MTVKHLGSNSDSDRLIAAPFGYLVSNLAMCDQCFMLYFDFAHSH